MQISETELNINKQDVASQRTGKSPIKMHTVSAVWDKPVTKIC